MHTAQQGQARHALHACGFVVTQRNAAVPALHTLQGHGTKPHQVGPHHAQHRGREHITHAPGRLRRLQPAHRQQQPHHNHGTGHGIPQAGHLQHPLREPRWGAPRCKRQQQGYRHRQHRCDGSQLETVPGPQPKTGPGQGRIRRLPALVQRAQHEQHWQHKTQQYRQHTYRQRLHPLCARQRHTPCLGTAHTHALHRRKPHVLLRPALQPQQHTYHQQQHTGQLGGRHRVVHGQPGLVNARCEGLNPEVAGDTKVGQRLHQRQGHPGCHCRAGQRQGHRANAA